MIDLLLSVAALGAVVLFLIGPSIWLLVSLYGAWETTPQDERVKQFSHAVAWPMVAIVILLVASMFATVSNPGTAYVDASDYDHARAMWHSDAHVTHFPDTITPHRVHHFYARAIYLPDVSRYMHVALDLSPDEARAVHQQADSRAAYVVTWANPATDSTSAQPTVLEHRSGPDPSEVALRFPKLTDSIAAPSDYVAYFFGARPDHSVGAGPGSTTVDSTSTAVPSSWPEDLTYGIAFHKSRARVLYWSDWER